jgi:hypothetical protein
VAVDGAFEEVEGQDEEEGGSHPVAAHEQEQSLLVRPEGTGLLAEFAKSTEAALVVSRVGIEAVFPYEALLHLVVYYKSRTRTRSTSCI